MDKTIKILAIGDKGGSSYHRLNLLKFSKYDVTFIQKEEVTEEIVKEFDLLYIRTSKYQAAMYSLWKSLYGFKIIYDRDDSFDIPQDYPNRELFKNSRGFKELLFLADCVTTSTETLAEELSKYNSWVEVIPNRIPYGHEQFLPKEETKEEFMSRKIKVGLVGSFYHKSDYLEIKPWLNTLVRNQWFKENCEFLIGGWHETAKHHWIQFRDLGKFIEGRPVDDYISLYSEFDVILCPLKDNHFNRCKSSLRVMEAGVSQSLCLLDDLYKNKKDFPNVGHIYVGEKEWCSKVLEVCKDKEKLWELKQSTSQKAREVDFMEIVRRRDEVIDRVIEKEEIYPEQNIYTIRYQNNQPWEFKPIINKSKTLAHKTWRFEYNVMLSCLKDIKPEFEWTGFFSWKFPLKTGLYKKRVYSILDKDVDCINFCKPLGQPYLKFTEKSHPGFMELFKLICKELELPITEPKNTIYSNFFLLRTPLYLEYINTIIVPALYLLENKYWELANKDANYKSGLSSEKLKEATDLDYYNFVTFICERLIGQWIDKKKLKTFNYYQI